MANISDYLEMRGDITLAERPFNDVDNVILASLSYLDFKGIVPTVEEGSSIRVVEACHAFLARAEAAGKGDDIAEWVRSLATIDARFVEDLAASARFGNASLRSYVDIVDEEHTLQFSALCIDLDEDTTYVSYRGTDNSLVGWREDFMLSFTVTEAQRQAAAYLEAEAKSAKAQGRKLYVGGHSKGGLLAAYAALVLPEDYRDIIIQVWSNDGPGMEPSILPMGTRCHQAYGERYVHVVPTYSVVGMLLDDGQTKRVVKSNAATAMQHDPMSWQVKATELDLAEGLFPECQRMNQAITNWMSSMDIVEREHFTNELFDVLEAGGATTLDEVVGSIGSITKVVAALGKTDQRTRDIVYDLFGEAIGAGVDSTKDAVFSVASKAMAGVTEQIKEFTTGGSEGE